ncbi:N-6 DNA methylase [Dysgonomonas sp. Marseille-P4677]|uniref:type I restriction-modification system subunit M n=1 Tax=Dysgonomonas sp. Marseille-P4677 TaxID=2364790 RepID=UPI001911B13F|nr:type I restriction-modification system subunit M [Dysgonomonas sp. Marseille-P4677]MBK5720192.1 N-6 DNA methylase [Dysgonomonas sp. Marseille-P4677]
MTPQELAQMIWSIKEIIRDDYNDKNVDEVILPFTLLRRLDCVMESYADKVKKTIEQLPEQMKEMKETDEDKYNSFLARILKTKNISFYNISGFSLAHMLTNPKSLGDNFKTYLEGFSENVKEILYNFTGGKEKGLGPIYETLLRKNLLFNVTQEFVTKADLHPEKVDNHTMGTVFEIIIRMSKESTNETAGQYYTPREIVNLLVSLVFTGQEELMKTPGQHFSIYDPCCGTGGMLTVAKEYMQSHSGRNDVKVFQYGQEINEQTYAICKSDILMKGDEADNIKLGNTISDDKFPGKTFSYMITNPPFGVDWKKDKGYVENEAQNPRGRFSAGLPDSSDGSLLFLMHMISKMDEGGSRIGIILNGSPLFNGDAGSGWSNIRKMLLDKDLLDTIVSLPKNLFYGTDISTYMWILDNKKPKDREGKVLLINGAQSQYASLLSRSLGKKRYEVNATGMKELQRFYREYKDAYHDFGDGEFIQVAKLMDKEDFLYTKITVDRPLRLKYENLENKLQDFLENTKMSATEKDKAKQILQLVKKESPKTPLNDEEFFNYLAKNKVKPTAGLIKKLRSSIGEVDETFAEVLESPFDQTSPFIPDTDLRDTESIPYKQDIETYFKEEVLKFAPDAWMDRSKDKIGCEFPFTKLFYVYKPLRTTQEIWEEIMTLEKDLDKSLMDIMEGEV